MRNLVLTIGLAFVLAACGPTQRETALAKTATFRGDHLMMYAEMKMIVEDKYKIERADETQLKIQTIARWYNPEGQGVSSSGPDDPRDLPDFSIKLSLVAELLPVNKDWVLSVRAELIRYRIGQSAPDRILENEILPGWIPGKVDQLQYAIYEQLKKYEVQQAGGVAPTPEQMPTSDPDEPPPASDVPAPMPDPGSGTPAP